MLVGLQEVFLDRILRIFDVVRHALSDSEQLAVVSLNELLEGGDVPAFASVDKSQVIPCLGFHV